MNHRKHCVACRTLLLAALALLAGCTRHRIDQADALLESGEFLEARALYGKVIAKNPRSYRAHYGMGMSWCAEAVHRTELDLASPSDWYDAIYHMTVAANLGAGAPATRTLGVLHFNLGAAYNTLGERDAAARRLEQAIAYDSTLLKAHNLLGAIYHGQGYLADAERCYARVLALDSSYAMAHFNRGAIAWARGDYAAAVNHFERAHALAPHSSHFEQWLSKARERAR
jgi:tetratricopeptide (TPR) repeat protein